MARIQPVADGTSNEQDALSATAKVEVQLNGIYSHRPEIRDGLMALMHALHQTGTLPVRLTELMRLRIAFWNQCRTCMSVRWDPNAVSEGLVCSLERPEESKDLSPAEKAAIRYADLMANDHLAIDDSVFNELRQHFTEGELVELGMHCGSYVGFGRLMATWHVTENLHERFQREQDAPHTPWGEGALRWDEYSATAESSS